MFWLVDVVRCRRGRSRFDAEPIRKRGIVVGDAGNVGYSPSKPLSCEYTVVPVSGRSLVSLQKQRRRRMCEKWKSCRKFPLRRNPLTGPCFHRNRVACGAHERLVLKLLKAFVDLNHRYTTLLLSTTSVEMSYIESCLIYEFKVVRRDHHHAGHKTKNHVNVVRLKYTSAIICSWRSLNCALANLLLSSSRFFLLHVNFFISAMCFSFFPHISAACDASLALIWFET